MGDLLSGKVQIQNVRQIITGTKCKTEEDFIEVIQRYKKLHYWREYTEVEAIEMYHKIKHLIWQPRLENKSCPRCVKWWVTDKNDINWLGKNNVF